MICSTKKVSNRKLYIMHHLLLAPKLLSFRDNDVSEFSGFVKRDQNFP